MTNGTFFESSNGWQFRVNDSGHMEYKFRESNIWDHLGTQLGIGLIEWAQSEIWMDESEEEAYQASCGSWDCRAPECGRM